MSSAFFSISSFVHAAVVDHFVIVPFYKKKKQKSKYAKKQTQEKETSRLLDWSVTSMSTITLSKTPS
jgi:hypothetical protein